jgi:hypothetical protein
LTVASERLSEVAIWWLERPRAAKSTISSSLAERTLSIPSWVPSSMFCGIPTTAFSLAGSSTDALTAATRCSAEEVLSK